VIEIEEIRSQVIGRNSPIETPFGVKPLVYADYTASGRGLAAIEAEVLALLKFYANTHSEDSLLGEQTHRLQSEATAAVRRFVNGHADDHVLFTGTGATSAIRKLQEILGLAIPPLLMDHFVAHAHDNNIPRPVVLVGPFEHHSNDLPWRNSWCDVEIVPWGATGSLDFVEFEKRLAALRATRRPLFGSFSAASNVTGVRTDVYRVAALLHRYGSPAFFDFAASAPYDPIDMNRDAESYFDAVFFSPHKFLGGPQSSGVLVFKSSLYRLHGRAPTLPAGGTVNYVILNRESYVEDVEAREQGGTPGLLQNWRAARALSLRQDVGSQRIRAIEERFVRSFEQTAATIDSLLLYGPAFEDSNRLPIVAFNIGYRDQILHPLFVSRLLGHLFGIQVRGGCFCASPYIFHLFNYKCIQSNLFPLLDRTRNFGLKLGMVRLDFHYTLTETEFDYIVRAIAFVAKYGYRFLSLYEFDLLTGVWHYRKHSYQPECPSFQGEGGDLSSSWIQSLFHSLEAFAALLPAQITSKKLPPAAQEHVYFPVVHVRDSGDYGEQE
jgi:selenocysteine lyase/cysteine desulfurase